MTKVTQNSGEFQIRTSQTYATVENARRAVAAKGFDQLRHFIVTSPEGRFFPVFVGQTAVQYGVHFHFNVVG